MLSIKSSWGSLLAGWQLFLPNFSSSFNHCLNVSQRFSTTLYSLSVSRRSWIFFGLFLYGLHCALGVTQKSTKALGIYFLRCLSISCTSKNTFMFTKKKNLRRNRKLLKLLEVLVLVFISSAIWYRLSRS
jgi:hypothetical protein